MQKEAKSFKRIWLAQLALVYNLMILFSVVLNLSWVETRAAGGQYTDFPISIRILYFFMSIGTAILIFI